MTWWWPHEAAIAQFGFLFLLAEFKQISTKTAIERAITSGSWLTSLKLAKLNKQNVAEMNSAAGQGVVEVCFEFSARSCSLVRLIHFMQMAQVNFKEKQARRRDKKHT